jgi:nicotinamidase-related amidase
MPYDPSQTAVVVVDVQNGFCHPDGSLYAEPSAAAIEPVSALVDRAHYYDEFDRWGEHVVEGSWEAELVESLDVQPADHVVEKHTYDAFHQTELEGFLDAHGIDDLLFCGTLANVCVLHTAGSAGLRDYRPVVVEDALGYLTADHRDYAVEHADWLFGETTTLESVSFAAP